MSENIRITFDVRGTKILVDKKKLVKSSVDGLLKDMIENCLVEQDIVIEEDPLFFHTMLNYYQSGILERPSSISERYWVWKCNYWAIKEPIIYTQQNFIDYFISPFYNAETGTITDPNIGETFKIDKKFQSFQEYGFSIYSPIKHITDGNGKNKNNTLSIPYGIDIDGKDLNVALFDSDDSLSWLENMNQPLKHTRFFEKKDTLLLIQYLEKHIPKEKRNYELETQFLAQFK